MLRETSRTMPSGVPERNVWLTFPNALTVGRLIAIVPFATLATRGKDMEALALFIVAGLTDSLDGFIARRFNQASKIGRLLDPITDKLFTGVSFVVLCAYRGGFSSIPLWVTIAVLSRDVIILAGSFVVYRISRRSDFKPSAYGKANTLIEISTVVLFLAQARFPFIGAIMPALYVVLLTSLLISVADYLRTGWLMARD